MKSVFWIGTFFFIGIAGIQAQEAVEGTEEKEEPAKYEIVASGIYAYNFEEEAGLPGAELHFTYWFTPKWGAGAIYVAKFDEDEVLSDVALLGSWNPSRWLTVNSGPNFGLKGESREFELSLFLEGELNIRPTESFLFGPNLGFLVGNSPEIAVGIHFGFEF